MSCSVKGCPNIKRLKPEGITFHRFPKGELFKRWLQVLGKSDKLQWSQSRFVCSKHFKQCDFITGAQRTNLKYGVVPSLFLGEETLPSKTPEMDFESTVSTSASRISTDVSLQAVTPITSSSNMGSETSSDDKVKELKMQKKRLSALSGDKGTESMGRKRVKTTHESSGSTGPDVSTKKKRTKSIKASHESSGSTGTDSSTVRKRVKFIQTIHNYSTSPGKIKKKYVALREVHHQSRKKLYYAQKTIATLKRKITTLKTIVDDLKQNQKLSQGAISHLEYCYEDIPHVLMSRYIKNATNTTTSREKYPEKLRAFACTLQFYSGKAYEYVRKTFALSLPHQSTIRKWCATVNCEPGFSQLSFEALRRKVTEAKMQDREIICSLMLDEMAIKKQIDFDGTRTWGYVDIGVNIDNYSVEQASEALVLMVVCHTSHWKIPIAYFLIKSLTGSERANIVKEAIIQLHEVGVSITSVTCDGPSVHFTMLTELGCQLNDVSNLLTWFSHPSDVAIKIYCLLDVCHMLKLMRNLIGSLGEICTPEGRVSWGYIKKLHSLQESETLTLCNKLKRRHIEWQRRKMKVDLAAQTLSSSVADALEFLNSELHHPDFEGVEATVSFIRRIDKLFDCLNSRSPWAKGWKAPLREHNEETWKPFLSETCSFLLQCTDVGGRPLYCTPRKTPILGFVISIVSVMGIYEDFVKTHRLNYLLTYKCSQDHLETFFCSVRARNGWNNNPSCYQFMHTFKRLLLFGNISERGGNCRVLDDTNILTVSSNVQSKKQSVSNTIDVSICRRYNLDIQDQIIDHDYDIIDIFIELNELADNVVTYISGYVVKMLRKIIKCPECLQSCIADTDTIANMPSYRLILKKNRGGLIIPSPGITKVCTETEVFIRRIMVLTDNKIPSEETFFTTFTLSIAQKLYPRNLFSTLADHNLSFPLNEESHVMILIKQTVSCYAKIRFYNLAKKYTEKIQGPNLRTKLNRLILFNHQ